MFDLKDTHLHAVISYFHHCFTVKALLSPGGGAYLISDLSEGGFIEREAY